MQKLGWLGVLLLLVFQLAAQTPEKIKVVARKTPLDQVLLGLKENYGFQFAFDSDVLSKYPVTINRDFSSQEETLKFLLRDLPLALERSGDVYLIIPEEPKIETAETRISGQVLEAVTNEPLPFSYVLVNRIPIQTDQLGNFNFIASADTSFNLQISHLGYFIFDTVVDHSLNRKFFLTPHIERIQEVKVVSNPVEKSTLIGDQAGYMKINHQIAPILPGHGDNSVFNLLRLMPGVLAAGEQSSDLLVWGAYESHSKIQFDGYTVFGLKNFNDNISVVNPFMVKNIEVMKGGYEARYGDRVGGVVDIAGKDGTLQKPSFTININSNTINSMLQVPLGKRSSVLAAYRQTYYQLYDPTSLSFFSRKEKNNNGKNDSGNASQNAQIKSVNFDVTPDYIFRDANLKYTYKGDKGNRLALSLYGGGDVFGYDMEGELAWNVLTRSEDEKNRQFGGSVQFSQPWQNGNTTNFTLAYSAFQQESGEQNRSYNSHTEVTRVTKEVDSDNEVQEIRFNAEHALSFNQGHKLLAAAGFVANRVVLNRTSEDHTTMDIDNTLPRFVAYLQDELPVGEKFELKTGLRANYLTSLNRLYLEPRISGSVNITDAIRLNAAWGIYHQFLTKTTIVDSVLNFSNFWINADEKSVPVLGAQHFVSGLSFNDQGWTASAEGFYKTTDGLTRYFSANKNFDAGFYEGIVRAYGVDIFLKKEYKRHMAWISYTLSKVEEHFPFYLRNYYQPAPQQQLHELKFAGILNYKSFFFSANYVFGSGFERFDIETESGVKLDQPYNRLDASLVYKFKPGKLKAEAGISVLNVFDTENIKYSNLRLTTTDDLSLVGVYADAVPFTPAVFLKIEL